MAFPRVIAYICIMIAFYACAVSSQGGGMGNCWFDAPDVLESTISVNFVARNTTRPDGRIAWNLTAQVTWQRPAGIAAEDMYSIRLKRFEGAPEGGESVFSDPCMVHNEEILVISEDYDFDNLRFGELYELVIHLYRPVRQQKSIMGAMNYFETPDCFAVTGDPDYCLNRVVVQYSGPPVDPEVNNLCRNSSTSLLRVSLSWSPPFQVNGLVFAYAVDYGMVVTPAPEVPSQEPPSVSLNSINVLAPAPSNGSNVTDSSRIMTELQGLDEGKLYYVRITPIVESAIDGGRYPGHDVELTLVTANWTDPSGSTTEINLATPPCEVVDEPTLEPTSNWTREDNSTTASPVTQKPSSSSSSATGSQNVSSTMFTATTPPRLPPHQMEPGHVALIVIFTSLIIAVIIVFIVITIKMARSGQVTKLPQLSKIPAMCKRQKSDGDEKKRDLNMAEKGAKTGASKSSAQTTAASTKKVKDTAQSKK